MEQNNIFKHQTADVSPQAVIGSGTKIWHNSQIMAGAEIGENCTIGHNVLVADGAKIGNNVKIQSNTDVWQGIELEDGVFVGPSVVFTNDINPRACFPKDKSLWLKTIIKNGSTIGANATIVCGTVIGRCAFIGAGAVVITDVPDYGLVVGNPAKLIGYMCRCGEKMHLENDQAECLKCQRKYQKDGEIVKEV